MRALIALGAICAGLALTTACGGDTGGDTAVLDARMVGGDEGDLGPRDDVAPSDVGVADAGPDSTTDLAVAPPDAEAETCPPNGYGYKVPPVVLTVGERAQHSPRVVWTGTEWGVIYFSQGEGQIGVVNFSRVSAEGLPVGEIHAIGQAKFPRYEIMWNGAGYVAVWLSARDPVTGFEGLKVLVMSIDGTPIGSPLEVQSTFDVDRISAAWAQLQGGMILYSRGAGGADGLYAQALNEGAETMGAPQRVSATKATGPAVTFGNGNWGAAWLDPSSEAPSDVKFALLNERGVTDRNVQLPVNVAAQGSVHVAFGGDTFGVAWSHLDEAGKLSPKLTIIAGDGTVQATPDVPGPMGFGAVMDASWHDPGFFGVAWQDSFEGKVSVGLTRINPVGVAQDPFTIIADGMGTATGLATAGSISNLGAFYTVDPTPSPAGFSPGAQVNLARIGPCR